MQCNLSRADRWVRVVLGAGLLAAGVYFKSWWGLLGVPLLINAAMGVCMLYQLFGISTLRRKENKEAAARLPR